MPTAEGLSLDLVFQLLRALNVPPAVLTEIQNAVPPPAPKKTAQQITIEQRCSQLRSKVDITKQQLAKLSKRVEALAKEHTEVAEKVMAKQTELAQLEVELEDARRLIMQLTPPPTPPSSQAPRGHTSPRVSDVASSGMAVDAELLLPAKGRKKVPNVFGWAPRVRRLLLCSKFLLLKMRSPCKTWSPSWTLSGNVTHSWRKN